MPNPSTTSLTFYPAYCLPLSPTYNAWVRLTAADVHALQERAGFDGQGIYFYLNHPIKWIRLVGVIVALDSVSNRWLIQLDDSCGATILLVCESLPVVTSTADVDSDLSDQALATHHANMNSDTGRDEGKQLGLSATGRTIDLTGVDVGAVVKIKGGVGKYRGEKQVQLERIALLDSTNDEVASWAETSAFRRDVLNVPWVVKERDVKRAATKAEGGKPLKKAREQKTKQRQKLESKQKHENENDAAPNQDEGKESVEIQATVRRKLEGGKAISARIKGRDVRIPLDQQHRLDQEDSWLPADPGQSASTTAARAQKAEEGKTISARTKGRDVRPPPDQQRRLDRGDAWLPADSGQSASSRAAWAQEPRPKTMGLVSKGYDALGL